MSPYCDIMDRERKTENCRGVTMTETVTGLAFLVMAGSSQSGTDKEGL
jgi:hypothetical protein